MLHDVSVGSIIDGLSTGVAILDTDLRVVAMNKALEALTGFSIDEASGVHCRYILRGSACQKQCPAQQALKQKRKVQVSGDIITRARELVPVLVTASPLTDRRGRMIGLLETTEKIFSSNENVQQAASAKRFEGLVGHSPAMQKILDVLPVIAATDSSVLITGETGTGKDLLASVVHRLSARARGPFVKINCGALPETLLESELFGHTRGAFTGAERDKPGRLQLAEGGTVYLTEVGDLHLPLQVKLLTFLDDREVVPLGGTRSIRTDVRVIAATHRNLESMVGEGLFRDDLLYRLNVVKINIPPLRDRGADIRLLLAHFLIGFRKTLGKNIEGFSDGSLVLLKRYPYPGNVRELKNIVEYAASLCPGGNIELSHLPEYLVGHGGSEPESRGAPGPVKARSEAGDGVLSVKTPEAGQDWVQIERLLITEALIQSRGNRSSAAKLLGWGRSTLWRKMKKHGLAQ
ncbi:MAG: sigma 54-interacting transcriptional regulator [Pseudomonadota bacterium]